MRRIVLTSTDPTIVVSAEQELLDDFDDTEDTVDLDAGSTSSSTSKSVSEWKLFDTIDFNV